MMKFFDDIAVGDHVDLGTYIFTADRIKGFATRFDPQPFHVDEQAAARSHFGKLVASGWHTAAMWMRLMVDYRKREAEKLRAAGARVPQIGPSPGFRELNWSAPVFVGDTISYASDVVETRLSNSRPGWGLMTARNSGTNQEGKPVISFFSTGFIERRP
jgi:acyl dehydratase